MRFQERNLDWFPRMRAMSLVSSDSEGEQNELRNLQEKLESTMKLVTNLSGQLSELKDQVKDKMPSAICIHLTQRHTRHTHHTPTCTPRTHALTAVRKRNPSRSR